MQIRLTERTVLDPGYRRAYAPSRDRTTDAPWLGEQPHGARVKLKARAAKRAGLSEAELIRLMRESGTGRPSTYAAALEALRRHGYLATKDGRLVVTGRGRQALAFLEKYYPFLLTPDFSAEIEVALDDLASGRRGYAEVVRAVWERLK